MSRTISEYIDLIKKNIYSDFRGMLKEPGGNLPYKYITPGSNQYATQLWDWDSWLTNIALRQICIEESEFKDDILEYEKGCILNFLVDADCNGWLPILICRDGERGKPGNIYAQNMHKPVINQHAAFIVEQCNGDAEWLREDFYFLQTFLNCYKSHFRHKETGLYFWVNDDAIGVDDDPSIWGRPSCSTGSIYLNCLMYKELKACAYIAKQLGQKEVSATWEKDANELYDAIKEHCWDERDGFYYSVDLNLEKPKSRVPNVTHSGYTRDYDCLIMRIGGWSGFLAMWAGIATSEQAKRMVDEHFKNEKTFNAPYGVRTLSKMEKMYNVRASGNPSTWRGPIWGIANYLVFRGLVKYGFEEEAKEIAEKSIKLFGKDVERFGAMHEYYEPETGEPLLNKGFQNWNYLVLNMIAWYEGKDFVEEF